MASFSNRNPIVIGLVSLLVIFGLRSWSTGWTPCDRPAPGPEYHAQFSEAAGLERHEVRMPGQGRKVTTIGWRATTCCDLPRQERDIWRPNTASIEIKTLLGEKYLSIDPAGDKRLESRQRHPAGAHGGAVRRGSGVHQLSTTVASWTPTSWRQPAHPVDTFKTPRPEVKASLDGLSRLS